MRPDLSTLRSERTLRFGIDEFLSGEVPVRAGDKWVLARTFASENRCTKLEVRTTQGDFSTQDVSGHGRGFDFDGIGDGVEFLTFDVFVSRFEAEECGPPRYWVLPLTNFVADWRRPWATDFDRHPLRIFPTPEVPDEITHDPHGPDHDKLWERAVLALHAANSRNHLIAFEFGGAPGFIERLPVYEDRTEDLLASKERVLSTAVMVGEVGTNSSSCGTPAELERWLCPDDLLMLLTLATGTEVGATWIELRDERGRLVRRFHRQLREARFSRGYRIIDQLPFEGGQSRATGTGHLVTRATKSKEFGQSPMRIAILHLVRSKYRDQSLDESLAHLFRGLDGLCEHYGLARQDDLTKSLNADQTKAIKEARAEAFRKVRALKETADAAGDRGAFAALQAIEGKVSNIANTDRKFGLALADLLDRFGMPDAAILDADYRENPRADRMERWTDALSRYRTDVIHHGYLRLGPAGEGWREAWAVINHLHDIMARILLQALEYDGGYQPTVVPGHTVPYPVDWVKPDTPAGKLGYGRDRET
jgi:hypothetical protein